MVQLGISAFYHDSAACLVKDGKVLYAVEEERFTEIKHDASFPINSIKWLLKESGIKLTDIDEVCWYENPDKKKNRVVTTFKKRPISTFFQKRKFLKEQEANSPKTLLQNIGYTGKISYTDHHLSHAAFTYYTSNFQTSAILTIDGVGEWATATIAEGRGDRIYNHLSINFPNSLGMFYSTFTAYLGFKPNEGEYKVMGLAPYGDSSQFKDKLKSIFFTTDNKFWIDQKYFTWEYSDKIMFNKNLCRLLGIPPRLPEEPITHEHQNLAAALQEVYEERFLVLVEKAKLITGSENLCIGGGCAYNGVANFKAYKYFKHLHIPFAPSDAGSAIGACLYQYEGKSQENSSPYLGPEYTDTEVKRELRKYEDRVLSFHLTDEKIIKKTAELLIAQNIVAWFQGQMEFGARALGNRSILASPANPKMREKLNYVIKKREGFRPFAPSVLEEDGNKWFGTTEPVPYMNVVSFARTSHNVIPFPAATHINKTCRVQTVSKKQNEKYYNLLSEMKRVTGAGVLLNTSFNLKDQTITMSPKQAIERFIDSEINYLVINNFLIKKI
jgi:carbamoyltransferase